MSSISGVEMAAQRALAIKQAVADTLVAQDILQPVWRPMATLSGRCNRASCC